MDGSETGFRFGIAVPTPCDRVTLDEATPELTARIYNFSPG